MVHRRLRHHRLGLRPGDAGPPAEARLPDAEGDARAAPGSITERVPLPRYPKVSVIVCSYNGGKTLRGCLESLDRVNYPDFEIILVDDGSKDDTQELVQRLRGERARARAAAGAKLPEFVNIVQPNMGLSHARNAGAAAATGEIFAYTDSDCMADPGLALLPGLHAAQRRVRRRGRTEYLAAGGELDPGGSRRRAGRAEPRAAHRCGGRAHPRLQHGLLPLGLRERRRLRWRVPQGRRRCRFLLAPADERRGHRLLAERDRLALPALHAAGLSQAAGGIRRGGVDAALQASHLLRADRHREMEGADLRRAALHLAAQSADHLPRRLWARALPVDLSRRRRAKSRRT